MYSSLLDNRQLQTRTLIIYHNANFHIIDGASYMIPVNYTEIRYQLNNTNRQTQYEHIQQHIQTPTHTM